MLVQIELLSKRQEAFATEVSADPRDGFGRRELALHFDDGPFAVDPAQRLEAVSATDFWSAMRSPRCARGLRV
ncbi:MAG: hypothetical protein JO069_15625 [Verrucomicrobia bacterium]|nr:hypothetical protein [Verrucomicrobiota bacterium]